MPVYEYKCTKGHNFDRYLRLDDYEQPQTCDCGEASVRVISRPMIQPMFQDYESPIDGTPITSKRKRLNDLARSDCVEYEVGMRQDADERAHRENLELERSFDRTVEAEIEKMPARKKEQLESELRSGADIDFSRR